MGQLQTPLFLLTGHQLVTEGGPLGIQLLFRFGQFKLGGLLIVPAVAVPTVQYGDAVAIILVVSKILPDDAVAQMQQSLTEQTVGGEDIIVDGDIAFGSAYPYTAWFFAFLIKSGTRNIKPVGGGYTRTCGFSVVDDEYLTQGVGFMGDNEGMGACA